jgi:hypothetical protein
MNAQTMTRHDLKAQIELPSKAANTGDISETDLEKIAAGVTTHPLTLVAVTVSVLAGVIVAGSGAGVSAAVTLDSGGW